jgi:hypothetical protein
LRRADVIHAANISDESGLHRYRLLTDAQRRSTKLRSSLLRLWMELRKLEAMRLAILIALRCALTAISLAWRTKTPKTVHIRFNYLNGK